jgi:hypothetical protein
MAVMQTENARLQRRQEDMERKSGAAEREAAAAREAAEAARKELRNLNTEVDLARARLKALQECVPSPLPPASTHCTEAPWLSEGTVSRKVCGSAWVDRNSSKSVM